VGSGRLTRGKTRPGRFRLLDPWIASQVGRAVGQETAHVVDVGIGARPDTTLELHRALGGADAGVRTTGLDLDPERVQALREAEEPGVRAVLGGFDAELPPAHLVRAANLLRQYRLPDVPPALTAMSHWLAPEGLLVGGTTDRHGDRGVFRVFRRVDGRLLPQALICLAALDGPGFAPRALTPYLPRGLGWHGHPGPTVQPLFTAWTRAFEHARDQGAHTPAELFTRSAMLLTRQGLAQDDPSGQAAGRLVLPLALDVDLIGVETGRDEGVHEHDR